MPRIPTPPYIGEEDMRELRIHPTDNLVTTHPLRWTDSDVRALLMAMSAWLKSHEVEHYLDIEDLYFIVEVDKYKVVYYADKDSARETFSEMKQYFRIPDHFETYTDFLCRLLEMDQRQEWFVEHMDAIRARESEKSIATNLVARR